MLSKKAKIYEFSRKFLEPKWSDTLNRYATTGFHKEIGWENKKVPKEIINAVDNHLLRINDNYPPSENDLALIARELQNYAILAIATRLMDDHYRPLVAYRYFWLKKPSKNDDIDGVGTLLKWWINQNNLCYQLRPSSEHKINKKTPSKLLVLKNDLKQNFYEGEILKEIETKINQSHINLFIDFENLINEYKYQQFHTLTLILSQKYNVPLSWAYNVNKLENPEQFTLIYHQGNLIVNRLNPSRKIFCEYSYSDENITNTNLKRCLMDIAKNKKIESNFLRLSNYLQEMDSHKWHWESIIDQTFLHSIQDVTKSRYWGLLAILMPHAQIFEWLYWIKKQSNEKFFRESIKIQDQFIKFLTNEGILDKTKIPNHIYSIIIELLLEESSNFKSYSLLKEKEYLFIKSSSFWREYVRDWGEILFYKISFEPSFKSDKLSQKISSDWKKSLKNQELLLERKDYYQWMGKLFAQVKVYSLAAFFYQLSWGEIPTDIYTKADIKFGSFQESSRTSGLLKLSIFNLIDEFRFLLSNLYLTLMEIISDWLFHFFRKMR